MSKYLLNKFLFTIDRDPELVERYREDPRGIVTWWEAERANAILNLPERSAPGKRLKCPKCGVRFVMTVEDASSVRLATATATRYGAVIASVNDTAAACLASHTTTGDRP